MFRAVRERKSEGVRLLLTGISTSYDFDDVSDVTRLLDAVERRDPQAAEELLPLVYEELRRLARPRMAKEQPGQTLQPTALVHEAWIWLVNQIKTTNQKITQWMIGEYSK